jgi:hypothetical protein
MSCLAVRSPCCTADSESPLQLRIFGRYEQVFARLIAMIVEDSDMSVVATGDLELEICGLAARVAASMCHFLLAVAEYDRRRAWEAWECRDMASWLSWKCGISPVTAREQVRVARSLQELPLLQARFAAGELSYSQTRAISRVATPATEASLIDLAQASTAAQLETITRAYRRTRRAADETEAKRHARRYLRFGWDDEGNLTGSFSLTPEAGAILVKALEAHLDQARIDEADSDGARDARAAAQADLLVEMIGVAARELAEDGADRDDDSSYLVTIIAEESALIGTASSSSSTDSGSEERGSEERGSEERGSEERGSEERGSEERGSEERGSEERGYLCQIAEGPGIASETALRLACDAAVDRIVEGRDGGILDVGRRARRPNRAMRRALRRRDGHCRFPGCTSRRVQAHHVEHWIDGGETKLTNLVALCRFHHRRVHEGGYRLTMDANGQVFVFHPNGYLIPEVPEPLSTDCAAGTFSSQMEIAPYTSGWDDSRLDLPHIMDCLLQDEGLLVPAVIGADSAEAERPASDASLNRDLFLSA